MTQCSDSNTCICADQSNVTSRNGSDASKLTISSKKKDAQDKGIDLFSGWSSSNQSSEQTIFHLSGLLSNSMQEWKR